MVLRCDIIEQFAIATVFHDEEKTILGFNNLVKLDYVWMAHNSKDVDLSGHALNIINVVDLPLVQYLDGHLLSRKDVEALLYLAERALPKCLLYLIVADETITHFYYFFMLLPFDRHLDFCVVDTVLKLNQSAGNLGS